LLVGNDVVDLRDPENQPDAIHVRFDERVFSPDERADILSSASPHLMRWALWAAKESAFKVARKMDPRACFSPRAFSVRLPRFDPGVRRAILTEVRHAAGRFRVQVRATDDWVHALASVSGSVPDAPVWKVRPLTRPGEELSMDASARVRQVARSALSSALGLFPSDIVIAAAAKRAPRAWSRGRRLAIDLSLSHHGRFVACAWSGLSERLARPSALARDPFAG
jgi:phosphopantetheinyl transferase (holo-ACP synthase)